MSFLGSSLDSIRALPEVGLKAKMKDWLAQVFPALATCQRSHPKIQGYGFGWICLRTIVSLTW